MKLHLLIFTVLFSISIYSCQKPGCTNPDASNYNSDANHDDGSCIVNGCMNSDALNYNPDATIDDGSCECNRDIFYGTYNVNSICGGVFHNGLDTTDYIMMIYEDSSNGCKVKVYNYLNSNTTISRLVSGNNILVPTQTYDWSYDAGSMTLSGDTLNIYTYNYDYMWGGVKDSCRSVGIKQ